MADNIAITPGSGATYGADEVTDGTLGSVKVGFTKIMDGTLDGTNKAAVTSSGALKVDLSATTANSTAVKVDGSAATQPVSASSLPLPTGAATAAKQPSLGTAGSASTDVITVQGISSMTALKTDGSAVTQPVSASSLPLPTGAATSANQSTANTSLGNIDTNAGTTTDAAATAGSTGTISAKLRRISADIDSIKTNTSSATPAGSNIIGSVGIDQTTPGTTNNITVSAQSGAGTANQVKDITQYSDGKSSGILDTGISVYNGTTYDRLTGSSSRGADVALKALGTTAVDTNSGSKSGGTLRVVLATDQPQLTNALKVDGSAVTQPVSGTVTANLSPATSGGWATSHLVSGASTNATNIKASAGQVGGWYIYNSNASARKVAFHNTAGTPTAGSSVFFSVVIPPSSAANVEFANGIAFSTGIAITTVTGIADSDSTSVGANDLLINIFYK